MSPARYAEPILERGIPLPGRRVRKFEESKPVAGAIFKDRLRLAGLSPSAGR